MLTTTDFSYRVFITDEGFINISVRSGSRDWHQVFNAFEDSQDIAGVVWDQHWLTASQKNEVSKAVTQALLQWSGEDTIPLHMLRDAADMRDDKRMDVYDWVELSFVLVGLVVLILSAWLFGKSDVGASWGW